MREFPTPITTKMRACVHAPAFSWCVFAAVVLVYFTWLQWHPYFIDPDSFYHITLARLIGNHRWWVTEFPWLPLTALHGNFADQAWAYHLILALFIKFFGNMVGIKILTVIIDVTIIMSLWWILRRWHVRFPLLYILSLLLTAPFIFRIALAKPASLAVLIFIWGIYCIVQKKWRWLFLVSIGYVWTHGSWPLLVVMGALTTLMTKRAKPLLLTVGGCLIGLTANPHFPKNLTFFWNQTVLIALKGYYNNIGIGSEWYPFPLPELISANIFLLIALTLALLALLTSKPKAPIPATLLIGSGMLLILTLRSYRHIEFLAPLAIMATATALTHAPINGWHLFPSWHAYKTANKRVRFLSMMTLGVLVLTGTMLNIVRAQSTLARGYRFDALAPVSYWLRVHLPPDASIVNTRWEDFPALWYYNSSFSFTVGLDPVFLYLASLERYRFWEAFIHGKGDVSPSLVLDTLGADTVVVKKDRIRLNAQLQSSEQWTLMYEDEETWVYQPRSAEREHVESP